MPAAQINSSILGDADGWYTQKERHGNRTDRFAKARSRSRHHWRDSPADGLLDSTFGSIGSRPGRTGGGGGESTRRRGRTPRRRNARQPVDGTGKQPAAPARPQDHPHPGANGLDRVESTGQGHRIGGQKARLGTEDLRRPGQAGGPAQRTEHGCGREGRCRHPHLRRHHPRPVRAPACPRGGRQGGHPRITEEHPRHGPGRVLRLGACRRVGRAVRGVEERRRSGHAADAQRRPVHRGQRPVQRLAGLPRHPGELPGMRRRHPGLESGDLRRSDDRPRRASGGHQTGEPPAQLGLLLRLLPLPRQQRPQPERSSAPSTTARRHARR